MGKDIKNNITIDYNIIKVNNIVCSWFRIVSTCTITEIMTKIFIVSNKVGTWDFEEIKTQVATKVKKW